MLRNKYVWRSKELIKDTKIEKTSNMKCGDDVQCGKFTSSITNVLEAKTAPILPDPHILHDDHKNLDLAKIDGHMITIRRDGTCESSFKVTSLGAEPYGINAARLVYVFYDENNREINSWDAGIFPVSCGVMNERRYRHGRYDGNLFERIAAVECPVPGDWVWCDGSTDD